MLMIKAVEMLICTLKGDMEMLAFTQLLAISSILALLGSRLVLAKSLPSATTSYYFLSFSSGDVTVLCNL
jgi:hypothetical protein